MKTLAILILTVFTTITSFASVVEPLTTTVEGNTITVYFDYDKSETVSISIIDKVGFELMTEEVETKNRKSRSYNLKQLPFGVYTLKIDSDQKIISKKIKTEKNNSVVLNEEISYKPNTFYENNRWKINLLSLGQNVEIKIYDAEFEPVYESKLNDQMVVGKSYDLSNLDYGVYNLTVKVGDQSYNKVIAKM